MPSITSCHTACNSLPKSPPSNSPLETLHLGCLIIGTSESYVCSQFGNRDLASFPMFIQRTKPSQSLLGLSLLSTTWFTCATCWLMLYLPSGFLPSLLLVSPCAGCFPLAICFFALCLSGEGDGLCIAWPGPLLAVFLCTCARKARPLSQQPYWILFG